MALTVSRDQLQHLGTFRPQWRFGTCGEMRKKGLEEKSLSLQGKPGKDSAMSMGSCHLGQKLSDSSTQSYCTIIIWELLRKTLA